jgi:hypothetical protein
MEGPLSPTTQSAARKLGGRRELADEREPSIGPRPRTADEVVDTLEATRLRQLGRRHAPDTGRAYEQNAIRRNGGFRVRAKGGKWHEPRPCNMPIDPLVGLSHVDDLDLASADQVARFSSSNALDHEDTIIDTLGFGKTKLRTAAPG